MKILKEMDGLALLVDDHNNYYLRRGEFILKIDPNTFLTFGQTVLYHLDAKL